MPEPIETTREDGEYFAAHRALVRFAAALGGVFAWVLAFSYFNGYVIASVAVAAVCVVYALSQATVFVLAPVSAARLARGSRQSLVFGALAAAAAFTVLGGTLSGLFDEPLGYGIAIFGVLYGIFRATYWIPYRLHRVRSESGAHEWLELLIASAPAFAGIAFIAVPFAAQRILFGAAALALLSMIPAAFVRDSHERVAGGYTDILAQAFSPRARARLYVSIAQGMQSVALFIVWPLFIFLISGRSFALLGCVLSFSLVALIVFRGVRSKLVRALGVGSSRIVAAVLAMAAWLVRLSVVGPMSAAFAGAYGHFSAPAGTVEASVLEHDHLVDGGSYLDEHSAEQVLGVALGRILMCAAAIVIVLSFPLPVAFAAIFIVAGIAAGYAAAMAVGGTAPRIY